jgi:hypothetical protein
VKRSWPSSFVLPSHPPIHTIRLFLQRYTKKSLHRPLHLNLNLPEQATKTMPILQPFTLPKTIGDLAVPSSTNAFFIAFLASKDPQTQKPWCPDVVAALPTLESTFTGAKKPQATFVEVGQRPE